VDQVIEEEHTGTSLFNAIDRDGAHTPGQANRGIIEKPNKVLSGPLVLKQGPGYRLKPLVKA